MKIPQPDWAFAQGTKEAYAEDGVRGEVGYEPDTEQWYVDLNDEDYAEYQRNLRRRHNVVLQDFTFDWEKATNIQGEATKPPADNENRLALYLIDTTCRTARGFKVKNTLLNIVNRKAQHMFFGSTCETCGKKMMAVLTWEDVKPKGR